MKKKIGIIVLILLIGLNLYFIYMNEIKQNKYIIFDNNNLFYLKDGYLKKQSSNKIRLLNYSDSKLCVNGKGCNYINFNVDDSTYLYDRALEKINVYDYYILTNLDYNLNINSPYFISEYSLDDEGIISKALEKYNINISLEKLDISKSEIELLKDGTKSLVYTIMFNSEEDDESSIYISFAVIGEEIIEISKKIVSAEESLITFLPTIYLTLDIDDDNIDEIVISNSKYSSPESTYYCIYKYNESSNKFDLINDCN